MLGKAGSSRLPPGVHCASTSSPKIASRASFTAKLPAFPSPRNFEYCCMTRVGVLSFSSLIAEDDNAFLLRLIGTGFGLHLVTPV